MFKASAFKLSTYRRCPMQYKFMYVDHLGKEYKTPKPYLTMGAHVHNALHDFYEKIPEDQRTYKTLEQLLRKRWRENRQGFIDTDEERKYGIEALQMLRLFVHKTDITRKPVMLEDYYDADINEQITLLGRIDRVDKAKEGYHVIDYKTGKKPDEENDKQQLLIYSYIVGKHLKTPVRKASCLYLRNYQWLTIEPTEQDFEKLEATIDQQVKLITADRNFQPVIGKHCHFCDFLEICPRREEAKAFLKSSRI